MADAGKWKQYQSGGLSSRYQRVLVSGAPKVGKSRFAAGCRRFAQADMLPLPGEVWTVEAMASLDPLPIVNLDSGEQGQADYLRPEWGDRSYTLKDPLLMMEAFLDFCEEARKGKIGSLNIDSMTGFWDGVLDWARTKLGEGKDPVFSDWGWIKKPNNRVLDALIPPPCPIVFTAWLKDTEVEVEKLPGMKPRIKDINKVSKAKVEKNVPYFVDAWLELDVEENKLGHATNMHTIKFVEGRIPVACPVEEIPLGKVWKFDRTKPKPPEQVWWETVGWMDKYRVPSLGVTWLGGDEEEARKAWERLAQEASVGVLGKLASRMLDAKTKEEYRKVYAEDLVPLAKDLSPDDMARWRELHAVKKKSLGL